MKLHTPRTKDPQRPNGHRWWMGATALSMLLVTLAQGPTPMPAAATAQADAPRQGRNIVYLSDSANLGLRDQDAANIDQINYAFALIQNGEATGRHWQGLSQLKTYLRRHPEIDAVLSVGGWGADGFSQACATAEGRQRLADSILHLMDENGFTGVDIDWEYPGSSVAGIASSEADVDNWYALLALLREGLDERQARTGRRHILSVALGAGEWNLSPIDPARLNGLIDQAVVMAYDLRGFDKTTGHHAGLYPDGQTPDTGAYAVKLLTSGGLSAKKLLLGVPAYGHMWRKVTGGGDGLGQKAGTSGNKVLSHSEIRALESQGYTRYYDETAQAAWWFNGTNFVSAEDEQSLRFKARWTLENGLLGTALWAYEHDDGEVIRILCEEFQ